jgi:colanic acid biosynthesis protein WcaH
MLLVKRENDPAKGQWWPPGGRILKNEKLESAAIRKCKEEVGLDVEIIKPLTFDETIFKEPSIKGVTSGAHTINVSFLARAKNNNPALCDQSSDYKWVSQVDEDLHPYVKKLLLLSRSILD